MKVAKQVFEDYELQQISDTFLRPLAEENDIVCAGEKAMCKLYGGLEEEDLNTLRAKRFKEKTATNTTYVQSKSLPPTAAAANQHSLRVFLQVQSWNNPTSSMDPTQWGWEQRQNRYFPVYTAKDVAVAPQQLLKIIRCTCKVGDCSTNNCSCRRNGLECTVACKGCKGASCANSKPDTEEGDDSGSVDGAGASN